MKIQDILTEENGTYVHCYKQGVFWVCYEQSAYAMFMEKGYKPTLKMMKKLGIEVVSVGFPQDAMDKWKKETPWTITEDQSTKCSFLLSDAVSYEDFSHWKLTLPKMTVLPKTNIKETKALTSIEQKILHFPLANKTPIEAMIFLRELQEELGN